jgi:chemotaxis protein MotA
MGAAIGIVIALVSLLLADVLEGGSPAAFLLPSPIIIIFGGTFGAAMGAFGMAEFKRFPKLLGLAMKGRNSNAAAMRSQLIGFAERARREGLLALEQDVDQVEDPFTKRGLQMVIDGLEPETVEEVLELEIEATQARHIKGIQLFAAMGGYSPTMGVLGTVVGLVNVLGNLGDPSTLGEKIAVAFIATLFGVGVANMLWLPVSQNLKLRDATEAGERRMALIAILAIHAGDNPRIVAQKLQSVTSPAEYAAETRAEGADAIDEKAA